MRSWPGALGAVVLLTGLCSCGGGAHSLRPKATAKPVPTLPAGRVRVPDVVGQGDSSACPALSSVGLVCGPEQMVASSDAPLHDVVATKPAAEDVVSRGSEISLLVSGDDAAVLIPNVVGETAEAAASTLTAVGLTATTTCRVVASPVQEGTVVSLDPASGLAVEESSAVTIGIGRSTC
jgi:beta-lactam-binding protein with PASTA domain